MTHSKRLWASGMFLAALATAASANTAPSFLQDGKLSICTSGDFPPMEFYANPGDKDLVGYEIDMVHALAKHWKVEAEFTLGDFAGLLPSLQAQRCDMVVSGMTLTEPRLQSYDGIAHFKTSVVLVASSKDTETKTPAALSGKILAIEGGTDYERRATELNAALTAQGKAPAEVQTYPGAARVFEQILIGRAAATITQDTTAAFREVQLPGQLAIPYTFPDAESYAIYIRKNPDDLQALKAGYEAVSASGELATIAEKWKMPVSGLDLKN